MAIPIPAVTFYGRPVTSWDHMSKPVVGSICEDYATLSYKIFDGTDWIDIAMEDVNKVSDITDRLSAQRNLTDEYLEEQHPDLKQLKEGYNQMRDKLKVFEILKQDEG